uniref:Uncharacterized protein n=1 Tax=Triticum urartu TaxID=4572 RepID=A0A8R7TP09_TRIUA
MQGGSNLKRSTYKKAQKSKSYKDVPALLTFYRAGWLAKTMMAPAERQSSKEQQTTKPSHHRRKVAKATKGKREVQRIQPETNAS